jgi:alcohol dehydrogenase class IV
LRPLSQGSNPWSDLGCREALSLTGAYLVRGVADAADVEARRNLSWAATLAGIAFGNAGCHAPHGMSYSVSGLVRGFCPAGYPPEEPLVPHGMSVIVNAPAVFRFTAPACPERHLTGAGLLGAEVRGAGPDEAGEVLADRIIAMMKATDMPNGIGGVGYAEADVAALTEGAYPQRRLFDNAPRDIAKPALADLYREAMAYW